MSSYMKYYAVQEVCENISQRSNWTVLDPVGQGSSNLILSCIHRITGKRCVLKLQTEFLSQRALYCEFQFYKTLSNPHYGPVLRNIPKVYEYIEESNYHALVMDHMGPSIHDLTGGDNQVGQSIKTIFIVALKVIDLLEYIHCRSIFHLDIKDQNIVVGQGENGSDLSFIDFGLSLRMDDNGFYLFSGTELPPFFEGMTTRSPRTEAELRLTCRNRDFGALLAMLMFLYNPVAALNNSVDTGVLDAAAHSVYDSRIQRIFEEFPEEFEIFLHYYLSVPIDASPDYSIMRRIFRVGLLRSGWFDDGQLEWTSH